MIYKYFLATFLVVSVSFLVGFKLSARTVESRVLDRLAICNSFSVSPNIFFGIKKKAYNTLMVDLLVMRMAHFKSLQSLSYF